LPLPDILTQPDHVKGRSLVDLAVLSRRDGPKPEEVTNVDKIVEKWPLNLKPENIKVVPAAEMFQ
jgi:hypothetical protein